MTITGKAAYLVGGTAALWGIASYPAYLWWGESALWQSGTAAVLCLVPTLATLVWTSRAAASPDQQMVSVLGGTGIRLFFVLGTGFLLHSQVPVYAEQRFLIWLLVFYLFTLAVEIALLVSWKN